MVSSELIHAHPLRPPGPVLQISHDQPGGMDHAHRKEPTESGCYDLRWIPDDLNWASS